MYQRLDIKTGKSTIFTVMITINIIGTGNLAWHLATNFATSPSIKLQQLASRSPKNQEDFLTSFEEVTTIDKLRSATITIIAVTDNAIAQVATQIPYRDSLVVHTSGSISIDAIQAKRKGVFYPLQSFSKNDTVDFLTIPICLEATTQEDIAILQTVATSLSTIIYQLNSAQRKKAHLAAVFANNFTNHCYTIAQEICKKEDIPFELLHALIEKTAQKAITSSPSEVQTGPAKRNDTSVITTHQDMLQDEDHTSIYNTLTASIISHYGKKL